jgi:transposase
MYNNIAKRRGRKRALVALGHRILIDVYKTMKFQVPYKDVGAEAVYLRKTKNREQAMIRSLERSGYIVTKVATA